MLADSKAAIAACGGSGGVRLLIRVSGRDGRLAARTGRGAHQGGIGAERDVEALGGIDLGDDVAVCEGEAVTKRIDSTMARNHCLQRGEALGDPPRDPGVLAGIDSPPARSAR